jgi:peroxiredoxin
MVIRRHLLAAVLLGSSACAGGGPTGLFALQDVEGTRVEVGAEQPSDVVVLAFWATWCQPCQSEMTKMSAMYDELGPRGLKLYGVNIDDPSTASQVGPWVARESYSFPVVLDSETEILNRYHPNGEIPFYVVLDSRGMVLEDHQGYNEGDVEKLQAYLETLLPSG